MKIMKSNSHDLIVCRYLPQSDKKALGWSRRLTNDVCEEDKDVRYDADSHEDVVTDLCKAGMPSERRTQASLLLNPRKTHPTGRLPGAIHTL